MLYHKAPVFYIHTLLHQKKNITLNKFRCSLKLSSSTQRTGKEKKDDTMTKVFMDSETHYFQSINNNHVYFQRECKP